jgi:hypothetical protein
MSSKPTSFAAYLEDPFPEDEVYPAYGRDMADRGHAVFMIVGYLEALGMSAWTHTLLTWLRNYDGLQYHLHEHDDPMVSVRQLLARYTMANRVETPITAARFASDLCELNFLKYRAAWSSTPFGSPDNGTRRCWMPLEQPWLDFVKQGEAGEELICSYSAEPWPPSEQLRVHLLSRFVLRNGVGS